jgi:hypothetical protein
MCMKCGCGKKKGQVGFGKGPKAAKKKVPKGSHMMPNGSMMKNSAMRKKE